ncbi:MAG: permease-like cell division protein FtsX [Acidobacteriota bacterium]
MNLFQALAYFLREASKSLVRSWKSSLLAVLTIAISLFVGGLFLLATQNLSARAAEWKDEFQVTVYLTEGTTRAQRDDLYDLFDRPFVREVRTISPEDALATFRDSFPSLSEVFSDESGEMPFVASVELSVDPSNTESLDPWVESLRVNPASEMVDDDRDWLRELGRLIAVVRGIGLGVGGALLVAAVLTTASVIKLTAFLYLEEIRTQRLIGATEFFVRGPFYLEGLLQGLLGGLLALALLALAWFGVRPSGEASFWLPLVSEEFLDLPVQGALLLGGAASGLLGAVLSLRRESLRGPESD